MHGFVRWVCNNLRQVFHNYSIIIIHIYSYIFHYYPYYSSIITLVSNLPYGTVARLGQTEWKIFIQDVMLSWVEGESLKMITVLHRGTGPKDYSIAWRWVFLDPQSHCVIYGPPSTIPVAWVSNSKVEEADLMLSKAWQPDRNTWSFECLDDKNTCGNRNAPNINKIRIKCQIIQIY